MTELMRRRHALMAQGEEPNGWEPGTYMSGNVVINADGTISWPNGQNTWKGYTHPLKREVAVTTGDTIRVLIKKVSGTNKGSAYNGSLTTPNSYAFADNNTWSNSATISDRTITAASDGSFSKLVTNFRSQNIPAGLTISINIYINGVMIV